MGPLTSAVTLPGLSWSGHEAADVSVPLLALENSSNEAAGISVPISGLGKSQYWDRRRQRSHYWPRKISVIGLLASAVPLMAQEHACNGLTSADPLLDFPGPIMGPLTSAVSLLEFSRASHWAADVSGPITGISWASNGSADVSRPSPGFSLASNGTVSGPMTGIVLDQQWER